MHPTNTGAKYTNNKASEEGGKSGPSITPSLTVSNEASDSLLLLFVQNFIKGMIHLREMPNPHNNVRKKDHLNCLINAVGCDLKRCEMLNIYIALWRKGIRKRLWS